MVIDIEELIDEVEKRPPIYDSGLVEYNDRNKKKALWEEVYLSLNARWPTYSQIEKKIFGKEVQKKWNSLRDCFRRELYNQNTPSGSGIKKKAKYKYFDRLLFLAPFTQIKNHDPSFENANTECPTHSKYAVQQEISNNNSCKNDSDDKMFLLSLLPSFKNYTMEEKYALRIEMMKTIMRFKHSHREVVTVKCEPVEIGSPSSAENYENCVSPEYLTQNSDLSSNDD